MVRTIYSAMDVENSRDEKRIQIRDKERKEKLVEEAILLQTYSNLNMNFVVFYLRFLSVS